MSTKCIHILIDESYASKRLDVVLGSQDALPSRSACARLIEEGRVEINATQARSKSELVLLGDRVSVWVDEEPEAPSVLRPNPYIPLDIRFEDEYLLVISKQPGLVCHPSPGHEDDTLANALLAHCGANHVGMLQGEDRPGIVHRLDMDTSGLMLCAKDDDTQKALQDLIRLRVLDRRYIALVHGRLAHDESNIVTGIARSSRDRLKMAVTYDPLAREAITTYRCLARFEPGRRDDGYSLVECHLYTGRTHQIRVHMQHLGHPLVGDPLYGRKGDLINRGLARQFLHSWRVEFDHPCTHQTLSYTDRLSEDLLAILKDMRSYEVDVTEAGRTILPVACPECFEALCEEEHLHGI